MRDRHPSLPSILIAASTLIFLHVTICIPLRAVERTGTYHGENAGDQFAISLCNAGDVNRDGYPDLVIGASLEDTGGDAAGACYLYFGGPAIDTLPDLAYTGLAGERFGTEVSGNGDLNGDGYADIAVSAPGSGTVYVFSGGHTPDTGADLVFHGPGTEARFGESIALEGDLNGDDFCDLAIGAPKADSTGVVYIYHGGNPMDTIPDMILRGEQAGDWFGSSVSTGGDPSGDGTADLLVGAEFNSDVATWAGKVYVYAGGGAMDTIPDLTITGEALGDGFGAAVAICGDTDGDTHDDFLVSAPFYNVSLQSDVGKVYRYRGGPALDGVSDGELTGELAGNEFGTAIAADDINGDDLADVIVGAPGYAGIGDQRGKVYCYHGGLPLDPAFDFADEGSAPFDGLGVSVAGMGMFHYHSDGSGEFIAGAWNSGGTGAARLYGAPAAPTGVDPDQIHYADELPVDIYPNPCSGSLNVRLYLTKQERLSVQVYDVTGRRVAEVFDGVHDGGTALFTWDSRRNGLHTLPGGAYFLRVNYRDRTISRKILLVR